MSSSKTLLSQHLACCALPADVIKAARLVSVYSLKAKQKQMSWVYRVIKQRMGESSKGINEEISASMERTHCEGHVQTGSLEMVPTTTAVSWFTVGGRGGVRATFVRLSCPEKQAKRNMLQINFQVGQGPGSAPGGSLGNLGKKGKALGNTGGLKHGCGSLGSCFDLETKPMSVGCGGGGSG